MAASDESGGEAVAVRPVQAAEPPRAASGEAQHAAQARPRAPIDLFDPGWLFLGAGAAIVASTVLIPAIDDLAEVRFQRDRAVMLERHRLMRLDNYHQYQLALEREEPALVTALAATQLNQIPADRGLILEPADLFSDPSGSIAASPFAGLEPPPLVLPDRQKPDTTLYRLTTSDTSRPWVMAAGVLCLLLGLLPKSKD